MKTYAELYNEHKLTLQDWALGLSPEEQSYIDKIHHHNTEVFSGKAFNGDLYCSLDSFNNNVHDTDWSPKYFLRVTEFEDYCKENKRIAVYTLKDYMDGFFTVNHGFQWEN